MTEIQNKEVTLIEDEITVYPGKMVLYKFLKEVLNNG
jgi:hypothetical protein